MGRENKNAAVAAVHRQKILESAAVLFSEKGFEAATIGDISAASGYSRRTVYAYFQSKEDILHSLICEGLSGLNDTVTDILSRETDFEKRCREIFGAMGDFYINYPLAAEIINGFKPSDIPEPSETVKRIFALGEEINGALTGAINDGIRSGNVPGDIVPELTVYILWAEISAFYGLVQSKGEFIRKQLTLSEAELCEHGFKQIFGSIIVS
ncbi:MAG: TetR/AcrR family transcriptional regulator [Huintestinicola sp.]|uniref:TetR/AcrR family transcriptional regulator n=1 Tax=Huintestinicola sp. TaxID=2981661 RepID=UPI003F0D234A